MLFIRIMTLIRGFRLFFRIPNFENIGSLKNALSMRKTPCMGFFSTKKPDILSGFSG